MFGLNLATVTTVGFFVIAGLIMVVGLTGVADANYEKTVEIFAEVGTFASAVICYKLGRDQA